MKPRKPTLKERQLAHRLCQAASPMSLVCNCNGTSCACPGMLRLARLAKTVKTRRVKSTLYSVAETGC